MDVELNIGNLCAEKNKLTVEELITREDTVDGISQAKIWRLKKKLVPKNVVLPSAAKKDEHGNLVSNKADLESLYLQTYKSWLTPNPVPDNLEELQYLKSYLRNIRDHLFVINGILN